MTKLILRKTPEGTFLVSKYDYEPMSQREFIKFTAELKDYKRRNKHFNVPERYVALNGYCLGKKVASIRHGEEIGISKLSPPQKAKLEKIGFILDVEPMAETILKTSEPLQSSVKNNDSKETNVKVSTTKNEITPTPVVLDK